MNRRPVIFAALAAAAVALSGCQTVLKDLAKCERHYDGTVSGGTVTPAVLAGQAKIDCCPVAGMVPNDARTSCQWPAAKPLPLTTGAVVAGRAPTT